MEPSGGVDDDHVHVSGLGGLNAVKDHGGRVRSLVLADQVRPAALGPDLQLVRGGSPEGVSRHQQDLLPRVYLLLGDLADGGGLAHAVDSDDQDHAGMGGQVQVGVSHADHAGEDHPQGRLGLVRPGDVLIPYRLAELLRGLGRGLHTHVRQDQALLQLVIEVLVQLRILGEQVVPALAEGIPGLGEALLDLIKKSHKLLLYLLPSPGGRWPAGRMRGGTS